VEPERQAAPEAVVAPQAAPAAASAGPISGGFGPISGGFGNAPLRPSSPAHVLALQRAAGNQAVSNLLQRDDQEKTPAAGPADFGVSGGEPQTSGTVTAKPDGDGVRAESPDVKYQPAKVWLQENKTLGGSQNFGFVQNLVTSSRGAVYRRGGDPAGDITSEPREGHGKAYDAVSDPNDDTKINKGVFAPFYWPPSSMNDDNTENAPAETDPAAHDKPGFTLPAKVDDGRLTEFNGADVFKLGVAVKKGDAVHTLKAFDWSVPWDVKVDANLNGAGKAVQSAEVQNLLKDGPDTSLGAKDWSLRPNSGDVFEGFSTEAEAMKRSPAELLNWIHKAKQYDQLSYQNICAALDAKAPGVTVDIACDTTHVNFGKDVLSASVLRDGQLIVSEGGIRLNSGESHSLSLSWSEAFGSASNLKSGTVLKVELYVTEKSWEVGHGFMSPFNGSSPQLTPGDGRYKIAVSL
jgi:hypothetical protein